MLSNVWLLQRPRALLWLDGDLTVCRLPPMDVTAGCVLRTGRFKAAKLRSGFQVWRGFLVLQPSASWQEIQKPWDRNPVHCWTQCHDPWRDGVLSSTLDMCPAIKTSILTLDMCKPSKMGSSAPLKLGLGPNWICRTGKVQITSDIWWPFDLPVNLRFWNFLTPKNPLHLLFRSSSRPEGWRIIGLQNSD